MTTGFQAWDSAGHLIVDTTSRLGRIMGVISVSADGSLSDAQLTTGTPFYVFASIDFSSFSQPLVTFSGATMTWATQSSGPYGGHLIYGVR